MMERVAAQGKGVAQHSLKQGDHDVLDLTMLEMAAETGAKEGTAKTLAKRMGLITK